MQRLPQSLHRPNNPQDAQLEADLIIVRIGFKVIGQGLLARCQFTSQQKLLDKRLTIGRVSQSRGRDGRQHGNEKPQNGVSHGFLLTRQKAATKVGRVS